MCLSSGISKHRRRHCVYSYIPISFIRAFPFLFAKDPISTMRADTRKRMQRAHCYILLLGIAMKPILMMMGWSNMNIIFVTTTKSFVTNIIELPIN